MTSIATALTAALTAIVDEMEYEVEIGDRMAVVFDAYDVAERVADLLYEGGMEEDEAVCLAEREVNDFVRSSAYALTPWRGVFEDRYASEFVQAAYEETRDIHRACAAAWDAR